MAKRTAVSLAGFDVDPYEFETSMRMSVNRPSVKGLTRAHARKGYTVNIFNTMHNLWGMIQVVNMERWRGGETSGG